MRTLSITMSDALYNELRQIAPPGKMSKFISEAVQDKLSAQHSELYRAYCEAARDKQREEELREWDAIDLEGWEDTPKNNDH